MDKNETKVQETEETATVRKLSLFDPLSEESTGSTNIEKENMDHKAEPTLEEDNEHIHSEEEVPNSEFEPEESVSEEDLNQDKEEEHGSSGWKPSYQEENKTVSLAYDDFIAPLIKSVQELSAEVDSLKAQLKTA